MRGLSECCRLGEDGQTAGRAHTAFTRDSGPGGRAVTISRVETIARSDIGAAKEGAARRHETARVQWMERHWSGTFGVLNGLLVIPGATNHQLGEAR